MQVFATATGYLRLPRETEDAIKLLVRAEEAAEE